MAKIYTCQFCGKIYSRTCDDGSYIGNNCFECSFWMEKMEMSDEDEDRRVIVNGQHYRLGNGDTGPFKGFGDKKFTISFLDGRIVESRNLWCQGKIPDRFRKLLPDNALFETQTTHSIKGGSHGLVR